MPSTSSEFESLKAFNVTQVSASVRKLAKTANSIESLASSMTRLLYDSLVIEPGKEKACALVRFFRTVDYQFLEPRLQKQVVRSTGARKPNDRYLTLFGTSGVEDDWNHRTKSAGHSAIPLISPAMVARSPMISRLLTQLGIEISSLFETQRAEKLIFTDPQDRDYNIFYVPDAQQSPFIPSKTDFVEPYGIRTVIGFGSMLPNGDLYAVILFFRVVIPEAILKQFTALALSTTIAVLSIPNDNLFNSGKKAD